MTEYVRVPREAVEEIADDLRAISLELTKKRATTPVSEDVFRKALALEAMLAASPQGEGRWIKHDGGPNPVPGKMVECKLAGTSFPTAALPSECLNWTADLRFGGSIIAYRVTEGVKP